ncbi:DUF2800 domain-containing protein [Mesorhizobium sp. PAMC28654]|uniref:DUF2800 domain-containing protein n=1 Tax=Mesorhizobium sp. PAMC28654 TaxID=2880934 RepID=UPI001D0A2C0D|nr:DUF2800 domain-containing protein [Mesorhizobium sp. PAMC28654]UDL89822.1 DUF2800 domain-containing protein [Mesorhizobium sp. PAMC28654]
MTAHTTRAHAKRSPSSAHRWMNCPGSIRMSEGLENKSSIFADEGTAAHMLAERCLRGGQSTDLYAGWVIDIRGKEDFQQYLLPGTPLIDGRFEVDPEMVDGVQLFLDTVREHYVAGSGDVLRVEQRVNFSGDEEFGTADAVIWQPRLRRVKVFDLKYGAGVLVEVTDEFGDPNPQLVCYGEGTVREYMGEDIAALDIFIIQPRMPHTLGPVRGVTIGPLELLDWSFTIDAAVAATHDPQAPLVAGEWCKWCPAAGACPQNTKTALAVAQADFDDLDAVQLPEPERLTPQQITRLLDGLDMFEAWAKNVRQYAYSQSDAGVKFPGYKLVQKVGRRNWTDEADAFETIESMGVNMDTVQTTPKLKSPAQIEKLVGKKDFAAKLSALAPSISSGTTLVSVSDKRPEVSRAIDDFSDLCLD